MNAISALSINVNDIVTTQGTKTVAELARVLANKDVAEARIAFAPTVTVRHPTSPRVAIVGFDVTLRRDISTPLQRLACYLGLRNRAYRYDRVLVVEMLRADGGSIGGSVFYAECEHADVDGGNGGCHLHGFRNHVASAGRADGLGVDVAYRGQGLATTMYRLAAAYARSHGLLLVPSTHVQGFGKNVWRQVISMGHILPPEYVARVLT